jgi:hypothetical protein
MSRSRRDDTSTPRDDLRRPALLDWSQPIPVEINLWSLGYADNALRPAIGETAETTASEQALLRFDRILSIAESATTAAMQSPAPDGYNWYRRWSEMLIRRRREAAEALAKPVSRQSLAQIARPAEEQLAASSARLDTWIEQCIQTLRGVRADDEPSNLEVGDDFGDQGSSARWVNCVTDGGLDRLIVQSVSSDVRSWQSPLVGMFAIVCVSVAAFVAMRRPRVVDLFCEWPHAVGFLLGIAWWAWLQPSLFGLLIAAACVALGLRPGWPGRAIRLDASTVLRTSRPEQGSR